MNWRHHEEEIGNVTRHLTKNQIIGLIEMSVLKGMRVKCMNNCIGFKYGEVGDIFEIIDSFAPNSQRYVQRLNIHLYPIRALMGGKGIDHWLSLNEFYIGLKSGSLALIFDQEEMP